MAKGLLCTCNGCSPQSEAKKDCALAARACLRLTSLQALHVRKMLLLPLSTVRAIAHNILSGGLSKAACKEERFRVR